MKENQELDEIQEFQARTIAISGASGIGKSTFSTFLAQNVNETDKKVLLIDFDLEENHVRTLLKIKKQPKYIDNVKNLVIKINKNLDVLCHLDSIFKREDIVNYLKVQEILNYLKKQYDLIIIDTSAILNKEYTKRIFYNSDDIIFLIEPNVLGVKKAQNMLEIFEKDWKINPEKIKVVLNKSNMYEISDAILKELFSDYKFIGKMKYMDCYHLMINKSVNQKEVKKEYEKVYQKICAII